MTPRTNLLGQCLMTPWTHLLQQCLMTPETHPLNDTTAELVGVLCVCCDLSSNWWTAAADVDDPSSIQRLLLSEEMKGSTL